jgi:hypothetical protein
MRVFFIFCIISLRIMCDGSGSEGGVTSRGTFPSSLPPMCEWFMRRTRISCDCYKEHNVHTFNISNSIDSVMGFDGSLLL